METAYSTLRGQFGVNDIPKGVYFAAEDVTILEEFSKEIREVCFPWCSSKFRSRSISDSLAVIEETVGREVLLLFDPLPAFFRYYY